MFKYKLKIIKNVSLITYSFKYKLLLRNLSLLNSKKIRFNFIHGSKKVNTRVILKSPFHYKLVKYICKNPHINLVFFITFLSNSTPSKIISILKKKKIGNAVVLSISY